MPLLAVGAVLAAGEAATRPFGWSATLLVVVPAVVASVLAYRAGPRRVPCTARLRRGVAVRSTLLVTAMIQIRMTSSAGRSYYDKRISEGKSPRETKRCLTRCLADLCW